jgi:oligoribonuclease NrnB/cAMP/cGMP phosphodiesterase (DHH superfamily)
MNYGEEPWEHVDQGDRLYIVDFSFPRATMLKLMEICSEVTCLDHHKTAKEALMGLNCAIFDMKKSGAMLAWEYWNPGVPAPDLIRYVQDRDLWHKALPHNEEIYMGLREQERTFEHWHELANMPDFVEQMHRIGEPPYREKMQEVGEKADTAEWHQIAGYEVPVVAACSRYYSDVCHELLQRYPDAAFSVAWRDDVEKDTRRWDFRSKGSFDVSAITQNFGGGGHLNSAGCQTEIGKFLWETAPLEGL